MRASILKSFKPDLIVGMLDMAVGFENWHKVLETADILYRCAQCIDEERRAHLSKDDLHHISIPSARCYITTRTVWR